MLRVIDTRCFFCNGTFMEGTHNQMRCGHLHEWRYHERARIDWPDLPERWDQ